MAGGLRLRPPHISDIVGKWLVNTEQVFALSKLVNLIPMRKNHRSKGYPRLSETFM
jgi:hypothetical protein